jgi:hypothetical protein
VAVSKIRQNVLPEDLFGDEDLPETPKIQRLTKPKNFIIIPSPEYETDIDFEKKRKEIPEDQISESWQEILERVHYDKNTWTISKTRIQSIQARNLDKEKTMEVIYDIHGIDSMSSEHENRMPEVITIEELQEKFKQELLSVASGLLLDAGFGGMKKGKLYSAMMDHIVKKIFNGKSLSEAHKLDIEYALDNMELYSVT